MPSFVSLLFIFFITACAQAQTFTNARIFAHNDYVREQPFFTAYGLGVGYIEADVFLQENELMVAHHRHEIAAGRTLDALYLEPLAEKVKKNSGFAYADKSRKLTLMIDLKTDGPPTLKALVVKLNKYPALIACRNLQVMISGNVPAPESWDNYPPYIFFDGRPGIPYTSTQLERVSMISTGFTQHVKWNGKDPLPDIDRRKMADLIGQARAKGKPFRFWATPDFPEAWATLMKMNLDVIVTDDVKGLAEFINRAATAKSPR